MEQAAEGSTSVGGSSTTNIDLIGKPFAVLESDPGVFTTLTRKLGVRGLEVAEIYDIEPWATAHLKPRGLIFCYPCDDDDDLKDKEQDLFDDQTLDPDAERVWFAYQLSNDACASQAILNIVFNLREVELQTDLRFFLEDTSSLDPVMRGLAITNCDWIREAHNSLARPADIRGAIQAAAQSTLAFDKKQKAEQKAASEPPNKRRRTASSPRKSKKTSTDNRVGAFHFIGYVPAQDKVWELDGLRQAGPLELGELPGNSDWMSIIRPVLKRRMQQLGDQNIQYNLLALVDDKYESSSDALEMLKRERVALERRLDSESPGWLEKVDAALAATRSNIADTTGSGSEPGTTFSRNFASRRLENDMKILDMPVRKLLTEWERCIKAALTAKVAVEEEVWSAMRTQTEHINRTFDYEPFIRKFVTSMHDEGLLEQVLSSKPTVPSQ